MPDSNQDRDESEEVGGLQRVAGAVGLLRFFRRAARADLQEAHPSFVLLSRRAATLEELALSLAVQRRDDFDAVMMISRLAGRRREDLRFAAADIRMKSAIDERRIENLAHRLLVAAINRERVDPLTPAQDAFFGQIDALDQLSLESAFEKLAELQPGLRSLALSSSNIVNAPEYVSLPLDEREDTVLGDINSKLALLVGPSADTPSKGVLQTRTAFDIARRHLADIAGIVLVVPE